MQLTRSSRLRESLASTPRFHNWLRFYPIRFSLRVHDVFTISPVSCAVTFSAFLCIFLFAAKPKWHTSVWFLWIKSIYTIFLRHALKVQWHASQKWRDANGAQYASTSLFTLSIQLANYKDRMWQKFDIHDYTKEKCFIQWYSETKSPNPLPKSVHQNMWYRRTFFHISTHLLASSATWVQRFPDC